MQPNAGATRRQERARRPAKSTNRLIFPSWPGPSGPRRVRSAHATAAGSRRRRETLPAFRADTRSLSPAAAAGKRRRGATPVCRHPAARPHPTPLHPIARPRRRDAGARRAAPSSAATCRASGTRDSSRAPETRAGMTEAGRPAPACHPRAVLIARQLVRPAGAQCHLTRPQHLPPCNGLARIPALRSRWPACAAVPAASSAGARR